ncbi:hypothetical protein SUGI_1108050 [Cryptomeria japonica]|nr:hypothetical protein SUGI_1108050 [Cryptomeria japonica]
MCTNDTTRVFIWGLKGLGFKNPGNKMNGTNRRFGGRESKGTPSLAWSFVVVIVSLLSGASIVHNIFKPNLTIPPLENVKKNEDNPEMLAKSKPGET